MNGVTLSDGIETVATNINIQTSETAAAVSDGIETVATNIQTSETVAAVSDGIETVATNIQTSETVAAVSEGVKTTSTRISNESKTISTRISKESQEALGRELAKMKNVDVDDFKFPKSIKIPQVNFAPAQTAINTGADSVIAFIASSGVQNSVNQAVDLCSKITEYVPIDLAKFEIIRDFYQILGILVECITFPIIFEEFFGTIAKIMSLAVSDLLKYAISISNLAWWWIITTISMVALLVVLNFFKQDVSKDIDRVGLNVEVSAKKFDWKKQNQKDGGSRYRKVKYLLFLMTTMYAPVSRNAIQMIVCADKYAYARFKCETINYDNATGTNKVVGEPQYGYLSKGNTLCLEVRQQTLPSLKNKGGLKRGAVILTAHEKMTITKQAAFTTTFGGESVDTLGGACWNSEGHLIHVALSVIVVVMITIRFPQQMSRVIRAFRPQPIEPDDPKHPYKEPPQLGTPNYNEEVRRQMELGSKPVWFNDEGGVEEFTNEVYVREIARLGDNPYVYLYEMYEEQWAHFKTYVMWFKFVQIVPAVTLTAWLFDNVMTEDSHIRSIVQASFAIFILGFYLYFSCKNSPFVNRFNDFLDQTCRMVLLFCPIITIVAYASENPKAELWGTLLNTVTGIHLAFLVISSIFGGRSAATRIKKLTGRLNFTIGSVLYKGKVGTLPKWDMSMERKRRLWKPFWDHIFHNDDNLSTVRKEKDEKTEKETEHRLPAVKPFVDGPPMTRPEERLEQMIETLHTRGFKAWESNLLPMTPEETQLRYDVQTQLEGMDVYCDDKWKSVPGVSSVIHASMATATGKNKVSDIFSERNSNWCTIVVSPFPFTVKIYWEHCNVVGELVSWGLTKPRIQELLSRNMMDPDIIWQRQVRVALRALSRAKLLTGKPAYVLCPVEMRNDNGAMIQYKKCTVTWTEISDVRALDASDKKVKLELELARQPRFVFEDGCDSNTGKPVKKAKHFALHELGIDNNYNKCNRLLNMLGWVPNGNTNTEVVRNCMEEYLQSIAEARNENLKKRVMDQYSLSWGFWYFVYNNDMLSYTDLKRYLQSGAEQNPLVVSILTRKEKDLTLLYSMLNFYNSSPLCAYWFSFWYDVWMHNQDLPKIKEAEKLLDFLKPEAICYKPMGIKILRNVLKKHGNPLGSKQEMYIKALYARLKEYALENKSYQLPLVSYQAPFKIGYLITSNKVNKILNTYLLSDKYNQGEEFDDTKPRMPQIATAENIRGDLDKAMKIGIQAAQQSIDAYEYQKNQAKLQQQQQMQHQQQQLLQLQQARTEQLKRAQEHQQEMLKKQQEIVNARRKEQQAMEKRRQELYLQQQQQQQQQYAVQQQQQQQQLGGNGLMAVQVPFGMQPGMVVQIQTPKGIMQVQIPPGVTQGMTFHVQT